MEQLTELKQDEQFKAYTYLKTNYELLKKATPNDIEKIDLAIKNYEKTHAPD